MTIERMTWKGKMLNRFCWPGVGQLARAANGHPLQGAGEAQGKRRTEQVKSRVFLTASTEKG
jgi:hypothetical protein